MTKQYIKKLSEQVLHSGRLIQVLARKFEKQDGNETSQFIYEVARRPPGVRLIIVRDREILLTREFRSELENWDYRLPGGKIFEDIESYAPHVDDESYIRAESIKTVINEGEEEAGIVASNPTLLHISRNGSAVEWNLYYYLVEDFSIMDSNAPEAGEIIYRGWYTFADAFQMCLDGRVSEDRSVGILLRYLISKAESLDI